jgi:hypothetical protein
MKKLSAFILLLLTITASAQKYEIKLNPIGLLFGSPDLAGEYLINEHFGAELTLSAEMGKYTTISTDGFDPKKSGFGVMAAGKYYFNPDEPCSGFYSGIYLRQKSFKVTDNSDSNFVGFKRNIVAGGFLFGQKWASNNGMVYELGLGIGRTFSETNEWIDEQGTVDDNDLKLGIDFVGRFSIGYRF